MTVLAWDGRFIAADSLATYHTCRASQPVQKIRQRGARVYALTGTGALFEPLIKWHENGAKPEEMPKVGDEHKSTRLLVWENGRCFGYSPDVPYPEEMFAPDAWGIGSDLAIGAMEAGADAGRAVEITIKREVYTGGPVAVFDLHAIAVQDIAA